MDESTLNDDAFIPVQTPIGACLLANEMLKLHYMTYLRYAWSVFLVGLLSITLLACNANEEESVSLGEPGIEADEPAPPESAERGTAVPDNGGATDPDIEMAPDFEREEMDGSMFRFSDYDGKVRVVNFWATWCMPCRVEVPEFVELQNDYRDDGLLFVGISLDDEGFAAVEPFAEEFSMNYPQVVDDGELSDLYGGVFGLPTTFVVDRQGEIRARFNGRVHKEDLEPLLVDLLDESV